MINIMGLDMFLSAKISLGGYHNSEEIEKYNQILKILDIPCYEDVTKILNVIVEVAYWRKSNWLHCYFVRNFQDGKDECQECLLSKQDLQKVINDCKKVLCSKGTDLESSIIEKTLPPTSGFFFGSTEIDEYYWNDIEDTVKILESIINNPTFRNAEFIYQSSW